MSLPFLPLPLARARSADNGDERNVRQRVEMPPTPTPASLATMPPQVVEVLVEQAALAARAAPSPPEAICEWMKAFCTALGARACPDDLFRRALVAWGFVPKEATREAVFPNPDPAFPGTYVNLRGEPVPAPAEASPPFWAGFGTWRSLFAGLCEAWYGRRSRYHEDYRFNEPGSMWIDATHRLRDGFDPTTPDQAEIDQAKARFVNPTMSQREKDTLIDSLLTNVDGWVNAIAHEEWSGVNQADWGHHTPDYVDHRVKEFWSEWRAWGLLDEDNFFRWQPAPWRAVMALLDMRGAHVTNGLSFSRPMKRYKRTDRMLYRIVVYVQRGALELTEEQLKELRYLLEEQEADPNPQRNLLTDGETQPLLPPHYVGIPRPPPLIVAIWTRSGPLVKLLLEFGATSSFVGPHGLIRALLTNMGMPGWTVEKEDAMRLLDTLREEVEQLDRDSRATHYDGVIRNFIVQSLPENRDANWPPVPDWMRNAVLRMLGPGPTPQA